MFGGRSGVFVLLILAGLFSIIYFFVPRLFIEEYDSRSLATVVSATSTASSTPISKVIVNTISVEEQAVEVEHIKAPEQLKAIYMTSWVAGVKSLRDKLVKIIDDTEINSVVIDIKDYTGMVAFDVDDKILGDLGTEEIRVRDMRQFISDLHKKGIYVIGRISCFQDPQVVKHRPDLAVKRSSDGGVWKDRKGISWIDADSKEMWDYLVSIGKASYEAGFDELNFDYIRFPSDGDMKDIAYPFSGKQIKSLVIRDFLAYLREKLGNTGAVLSADLFGMTTTNTDDLNIGQVLEYALYSMDFVYPMVYPSHYPAGFAGYKNPNAVPYEIIKKSMGDAVKRAIATSSIFKLPDSEIISVGTSTPVLYSKPSWDKNKLRPWLQDFSLSTPAYGVKEIKDQIKATYDVGLNSWLLWSASNKYTVGALGTE